MFRAIAFASTLLIYSLSSLSGALSQQTDPTITGSELIRYCESSVSNFDKGFCAGFVTSAWTDYVSNREQRYLCDPPNATVEQATQVVHKYLAGHPEELHEDALILIFHAFRRCLPLSVVRGDGQRKESRLIQKILGIYLGSYLRPSSPLLHTSVIGGRAVEIRGRPDICALTRLCSRASADPE